MALRQHQLLALWVGFCAAITWSNGRAAEVNLPGCFKQVCVERIGDKALLVRNEGVGTRSAYVAETRKCGGFPLVNAAFTLRPNTQRRIDFLRTLRCNTLALSHSRGALAEEIESVKYRVPIAAGYRFDVTQGPGNPGNHARFERNAHDFAAVPGVPIVAARDGLVLEAVDTFSKNCRQRTKRCLESANRLVVEHSDGSIAYYVHMQYGSIRVKVGDQVKSGQIVANLGDTGYATGPHLHFDVVGVSPLLDRVSLRIEFEADERLQ